MAHTWRMALGCWLGELRRARGLTQADLAAIVGVGKDGATISSIECGRTTVSSDHYRALSAALQVPEKTFARVVLRCVDPALYGLLYGMTPQLEAELELAKRPPPIRKARARKKRTATRRKQAKGNRDVGNV